MTEQPKILTVRLSKQKAGIGLTVEHGTVEIEKVIPENEGLVRLSAIFNHEHQLIAAELVTQKT